MPKAVICALLVAIAGTATAQPAIGQPIVRALTPTEKLERARAHFRAKQWAEAQFILKDLLYPERQVTREEEVIEVRLMLGTAYLMQGDRDNAIAEYERVLELDFERGMSEHHFSEDAIRLFEDTRERMRERIAADVKRRELLERERRLREYIETIGYYETNSFAFNFIPFGAGQFQNKHRVKGYLLGGAQALTAAVSAGCFLYLASKYGLSSENVPLEDARRVRRIQQVELGTGAAFWVLWLAGVLDGMRHYEPTTRIRGDDAIRDVIDLDKPPPAKPQKKASLRDRLRLAPLLSPTGVGLGLSLELN
jgi:AraC-like DNA-binding protein